MHTRNAMILIIFDAGSSSTTIKIDRCLADTILQLFIFDFANDWFSREKMLLILFKYVLLILGHLTQGVKCIQTNYKSTSIKVWNWSLMTANLAVSGRLFHRSHKFKIIIPSNCINLHLPPPILSRHQRTRSSPASYCLNKEHNYLLKNKFCGYTNSKRSF